MDKDRVEGAGDFPIDPALGPPVKDQVGNLPPEGASRYGPVDTPLNPKPGWDAQAKLDNRGMKERPDNPTPPIKRSRRKAARGK